MVLAKKAEADSATIAKLAITIAVIILGLAFIYFVLKLNKVIPP